ncbi:MAG: DUF7507 domain-containing protein [Acidimicrobiia bacterium]
MPHTLFPIRGTSRRILGLTLAALLTFTMLLAAGPAGAEDEVVEEQQDQGLAELTLEKATNGVDADEPPGPSIPVTEPVVWTFVVTNTGDVPVWDIAVVDDDSDQAVSCDEQSNGEIRLEPGESVTCSSQNTSWYSQNHKQHQNTATTTGTSPLGTVRATDRSHYTPTVACPFAQGEDNIVINLLAADGRFLRGHDLNPDTLGPIAASIPAGSYSVSWLSYDSHSVNSPHPSQTEEVWYLEAGGLASETTSDIPEDVDFASGTLSRPWVLDADQTSLTVHHGGPSGKTNSVYAVCVELDPLVPSVDIDKERDQTVLVGQKANFTITVTNDGDMPLNDVVVADPKTPSCAFASGDTSTDPGGVFDGTLDADESVTYTCSTGALDEGFTNVATVNAKVGETPVPSDSSSAVVIVKDPGVLIDKWFSGDTPNEIDTQTIEPGDTPTFTIRVTNTGTANLEDVEVSDPLAPGCDASIGALAVGDFVEYECEGNSTDESFTNVADAMGKVVGFSSTVDDSDPSEVVVEPADVVGGIEIVKLVDDLNGSWVEKAQYPAALTSATWQISVTNATSSLLYEVDLEDVNAPACETAFGAAMVDAGYEGGGVYVLPPAASVTFECSSTITAGAPESNTATVVAIDPFERVVGPVSSTALIERVAASGLIGDTVWADENENGKQDNGEKGIANAVVRLTFPDGTTADMKTNANGLYLFSGLEEGTYKAELMLSSIPKPTDGDVKLTTTGSFTITLADGQSYLDADFGVASTLPVTGISSDRIALIAVALLLSGTVAIIATRPRAQYRIVDFG